MCYITAGDVNSLKQHCIKRFFQHYSHQTEAIHPRETGDCVRRRSGIRADRSSVAAVTLEPHARPFPSCPQRAGRRQSVGSHVPAGPRGPGGPGGPFKLTPGGPEQKSSEKIFSFFFIQQTSFTLLWCACLRTFSPEHDPAVLDHR